MPVTAKLSHLYERVGEATANELVDWFNQVDATYRSDLRELNELNFARFDAKVEQRIATLEARLEARIDSKLDSAVAQHAFAQLDAKIGVGLTDLRTEIEKNRTAVEKGLKDQTRWLVLALAAFLIPLMGLWLRG